MSNSSSGLYPGRLHWPAWQRMLFIFLFVYVMLFFEPWIWLGDLPYLGKPIGYYFQFKNWLLNAVNANLFKTYTTLVPPNGSGDKSTDWTELKFELILALLAGIIWTLVDRKTKNNNQVAYWLRQLIRYGLLVNCFYYGVGKIALTQMHFPTLSQQATPLGDLLPMRLAWLFIGYSEKYQFFLGLVEMVAAILLFFRRTVTLGALLCVGIFANVAMMNLSYDIPVKIFSIHLFILSIILLSFDSKRLFEFFIGNRTVAPSDLYNFTLPKKWMRISAWLFKYGFIGFFYFLFGTASYFWPGSKAPKTRQIIRSGLYEVKVFVINHDTLPPLLTDTVRWKDVVFEEGNGSINTTDTLFWQRYRRGYFKYAVDSVKRQIKFSRQNWTWSTWPLFDMNYEMPDTNTIRLWGKIRNDSIYTELKRSNRHFQLAEKQFHWLSNYNR